MEVKLPHKDFLLLEHEWRNVPGVSTTASYPCERFPVDLIPQVLDELHLFPGKAEYGVTNNIADYEHLAMETYYVVLNARRVFLFCLN